MPDSVFSSSSPDLGLRSHLEALRDTVGAVAQLAVVDVGCGTGELDRALAAQGATVTGVDPLMPASARSAIGEGSYEVLAACGDALPMDDASVDLILFVYSLHHVDGSALGRALGEARRVLRPRGRLYVAEPLAEGPGHEVTALYHDETAVRAAAKDALVRYAGPAFATHKHSYYVNRRHYANFEAYAQRMIASQRFNGYRTEDVIKPAVRERFESLARAYRGNFDQRVHVDLYGP